MPFVESNHMVEQLAAAALPPNARQLRSATDCGRKCKPDLCPGIERQAESPSRTAHPVMDQKSRSRSKRKRLPQLLNDPAAGRMLRDVEVQDTSAIVADDKETVEDAECDGGHGEEVPGRNRFLVILKKRTPTFDGLGISWCPLHPVGDSSLGYLKAHMSNSP